MGISREAINPKVWLSEKGLRLSIVPWLGPAETIHLPPAKELVLAKRHMIINHDRMNPAFHIECCRLDI
jgi:hypothetical protein